MRLVIAGGGTGGHLFPALALAEELLSRPGENSVLFMGARGGMEERLLPLHGYRLETLPSLKGSLLSITAPRRAWLGCRGYFQARRAILGFGADAVVGMGGYASALPVLAAWGVEVPCMLLEQNVIPGRANRFLARFADEIGVQFVESAGRFSQTNRVKLVGNPLRRKVVEVARAAAARNIELTQAHKEPLVLILGGSQGARALNDMAVKLWPKLRHCIPGVRVILVSGRDDEARMVQAFASAGIRGQVLGFTEGMEELYAQADVVLARAGATTLAEIAAFALPSVLVPYPFAANDHQTENAKVFAAHGAAWMMPQKTLEVERLAQRLADAALQPERRRKMAMAAAALGQGDAATDVIERLQGLVTRKAQTAGAVGTAA